MASGELEDEATKGPPVDCLVVLSAHDHLEEGETRWWEGVVCEGTMLEMRSLMGENLLVEDFCGGKVFGERFLWWKSFW